MWVDKFVTSSHHIPNSQPEVIEGSDESEGDDSDSNFGRRRRPRGSPDGGDEEEEDDLSAAARHRLADADGDSSSGDDDGEVDEAVMALRRQKLRERAMNKIQQEEEVRQQSMFLCITLHIIIWITYLSLEKESWIKFN